MATSDTDTPSGVREVSRADMDRSVAEAESPPVGVNLIRLQTPGSEPPQSSEPYESLISGVYGGDDRSSFLVPIMEDGTADLMARNSWAIMSIIGALLDNVYGAPVSFEPLADPATADGKKVIRRWVRLARSQKGTTERTWMDIPQAAVDEACRYIEARVEYEMALCEGFVSCCGVEQDFQTISIMLGYDLEVRGRAYLEVLRAGPGRGSAVPNGLLWSPARYIKTQPQGAVIGYKDVEVMNPLVIRERDRFARFHAYYQVSTIDSDGTSPISYFKALGDPRVRSRGDGAYYDSFRQLRQTEAAMDAIGSYRRGTARLDGGRRWPIGTPATEMLHFALGAPWASSTGIPGWYSAIPEIAGMRELSQENRGLLSGQLVPSLMMLVFGGAKIDEEQQTLWQKQLEQIKPGERSIVIMQILASEFARAGIKGAGGEPKGQIVNTKPSQQDDALGLNYTAACEAAIRRPYRMPKAILGDIEGANAESIQSAFRFSEAQVFGPRRENFDGQRQRIFDELGVFATRLASKPRVPLHLGEISEGLQRLGGESMITPAEARPLLQKVISGLGGIKETDVWAHLPRRAVDAYMMARVPQAGAAFLDLDAAHAPPPELMESMPGAPETSLETEEHPTTDGPPQAAHQEEMEDGATE